MTVACIVQARVKSTRLPGKTMLTLPTGRSVVNEVLHRCNQIYGIDRRAVVIPDTTDCLILHDHIIKHIDSRYMWHVYCGPELDVLERYRRAASILGADHIMRITADCPCIDPHVCGLVLSLHLRGEYDYTSNVHPRSYPIGHDCEVFTRELLEWSADHSVGLAREHVTTDMSNGNLWKVGNVSQEYDETETLLTLDTVDDYVRICEYLS